MTFYLGILTLIISVLTYVAMTATKSTILVMSVVVASTLFPTTFFIFVRPLLGGRKQKSSDLNNPQDDTPQQTEERSLLEGGRANIAPPRTPS
jgi:hypothetical protein